MIVIVTGLFTPAGEQWRHIRSTLLADYIVDTALLAVGVTAGAGLLGTVLAWLTVNYEFPGSRTFSWALGLPIALPAYISAYTYSYIFGITGPVYRVFRLFFGSDVASRMLPDIMSLPGAVVILVLALYPYVYLTVRSFFAGSSRRYIETARSCGRGDLSVFFRVALPIARPAIVAGAALVLMETLNEYGATSYFGVNTMVVGIFRAWFSLGDVESAVRLAAYFLVVVVALLSLERINRRRRRYDDASPRPFDPARPGRRARMVMSLTCAVPLVFGLSAPVAQLLVWTFRTFNSARMTELSQTLTRSVLLAGGSGVASIVVSLLVVYFTRRERGVFATVSTEAIMSGYAVPGAIIAVGILTVSRLVNQMSSIFLFGSLGLLVYAYVVRYLAITTKPLQAAAAKIPPSFEDAGALSGRSRIALFFRVRLPLMRGAVGAGFLVVGIDLLKELPMTLALRPFNFDTLATRAFELAQQDRISESALPALAIVLIGIVPALLLTRRPRVARRQAEVEDVSRAA